MLSRFVKFWPRQLVQNVGVDFLAVIGATSILSCPNDPLGDSFDLGYLEEHNFPTEHDASLSRAGYSLNDGNNCSFNQSIFNNNVGVLPKKTPPPKYQPGEEIRIIEILKSVITAKSCGVATKILRSLSPKIDPTKPTTGLISFKIEKMRMVKVCVKTLRDAGRDKGAYALPRISILL